MLPRFNFVFAVFTACFLFASASAADRPNIVLIMADDQGYGDVGIHGNQQLFTPHLDRFARDGVQLTRFYCSPVCAPTRASLMTGRYYYRSGVIHTSRGGAKMHGDEITLAELLKKAGYRTGIFGKWHLGDNYPMRPQDQGFDEVLVHRSGGIGQTPDKPNSYFDPLLWRNGQPVKAKGYCTDVFTDAAIQFITANQDQPFFVYLPTNAPHTPLEVSDELADPFRKAGLSDTTARVYGMVKNIDDNVGRLLAKLDELKLRDNTLVIFLTDNGPQQNRYTAGLRGRKSTTYEGGIRVPCFVQWPARLKGGRSMDRIAAHLDLMPTVLAACGARAPADLKCDGVNLLPLLAGESTDWPERRLFFQCHRGLTPKRYQNCAVVTQRYKLVGSPGTFSSEDFDPGDAPEFELYDLREDEGEQRNLAAAMPEKATELRTAYEAWFDDVRATRGFTPGLIILDAEKENPARLCRYQDGDWREGRSHGWTVRIERGGRYRLSIHRDDKQQAGTLHVTWQDKELSAPLASGRSSAEFDLAAGEGVIDVWFQAQGRPRRPPRNNDPVGDVDVERLR
jgi:arylsulfatase A-like enzyme